MYLLDVYDLIVMKDIIKIFKITNLGFGRIMNTSKKEQFEDYVENIVYNYLIYYRWYDVKKGEVGFIALK